MQRVVVVRAESFEIEPHRGRRRQTLERDYLDIAKRCVTSVRIILETELTEQFRRVAPSIFDQVERDGLPVRVLLQTVRADQQAVEGANRDVRAAFGRHRAFDLRLGTDQVAPGRSNSAWCQLARFRPRLEISSTPPVAGEYVHENLLSFRSCDNAYQSAGAPLAPAARSPFLTRLVWEYAGAGQQNHDAHRRSATNAMNRRIRSNAHPIKCGYEYARPDVFQCGA